ncbi:hypothetical protein [Methylobacterium sp. CM6257]|jgi:hypothetical protein
MANRDVVFEAEAGVVTFMLLSSAFRELAVAIRGSDPQRGNALLLELEERLVATLEGFEADRPDMAGSPVLHEAARRVCTVVRASRGSCHVEGSA